MTTAREIQPMDNYGPYGTEEATLQAIVDRLARELRPVSIYLFGSRAEGRSRPDSDFDLAVVLDDTAEDDLLLRCDRAYAPLLGCGIGCDVLPCRRSEFEEVLNDPTNPWRQTWSAARIIYERP